MKFDILYVSARSISIELCNDEAYAIDAPYQIYVDGNIYASNAVKNVYSIYNLLPDKSYEIMLLTADNQAEKVMVKTLEEYVTLNVKKFGAKGDGVSNDTCFIQACIQACPIDGRVFIPQGDYYIGPLFLKSNMTIELAKGAHLIGDTNRNNYPILPGITLLTDESDEYNLGSWEGNPLDCFASIITGINIENVNIIGEGIIDGNAQNSDWWLDPRTRRGAWRPRGIFLNNCKNISFQGVTVTNTPSWNLHPYFSKNIRFIDMQLISPKESPNTDGCDPESCENVDIIGVYFSVGDDCIAIKAGKIYMGRKHKRPSKNFNIRNCSMNFGHGAVVLGSEMSGGIRDINVTKCLFNQTDRGLRIKTRRGRGKDAIIDGILFENIKMVDVLTPLVINMFYYCDPDGKSEYVWSKEKLLVDDTTPYLGRFHFKNIICSGVNVASGAFYGLPEAPIKEIFIENVEFNYSANPQEGIPAMMSFLEPMKAEGLLFNYVDKVILNNVKLHGNMGEEVVLNHVESFERR